VRGIPVGKIRAAWCKATEFRRELFRPGPAADLKDSYGFSFSVDGFFDGSKTRQTALVGAYETCAGERGSFLLILAWPQGKLPVVRYVHEMGIAFGMVKASKDSTLTVLHCMDCDHSTSFKWDKSKKRFVGLPYQGD
jgi:hypothetical protein